ncbi:hypothetical protein GCM10023187_07820 [Nibrella viscosa]|uniref:Uncharacterized protein n=1 Tax=Nibrella viscosa TaxID=1084524 RepID=A0ABP8JYE3_9BACT
MKPLRIRNNFAEIFPCFIYSLKSIPDIKNPLNTKNKSTPIHPKFFVNVNNGICLKRTKRMAVPLKKSSSLSRFIPYSYSHFGNNEQIAGKIS